MWTRIFERLLEKLPLILPIIIPKLKKAYCEDGLREKLKAKLDPNSDRWWDELIIYILDIVLDCDGD